MGDSGQCERKWAERSSWLAQAKPECLLQPTVLLQPGWKT